MSVNVPNKISSLAFLNKAYKIRYSHNQFKLHTWGWSSTVKRSVPRVRSSSTPTQEPRAMPPAARPPCAPPCTNHDLDPSMYIAHPNASLPTKINLPMVTFGFRFAEQRPFRRKLEGRGGLP